MKLSDFTFDLPGKLIAQHPLENRSDSRMMVLDRSAGTWEHKMFRDIVEILQPDDLLVRNQSKVIPSRLLGKKVGTGGAVECFLLQEIKPNVYDCLIKASKRKDQLEFELAKGLFGKVINRNEDGGSFRVEFQFEDGCKFKSIIDFANECGHIPLPPYISREDELADRERYQTLYANEHGSVAAPTAGLHFSEEILNGLSAKGIQTADVTLHVGIGTFQPIRVENIDDHKMHRETIKIAKESADKILKQKQDGKRVVAIGTTSVRSLESAALKPEFHGSMETNLFIKPGFEFKIVDTLLTNLHQPESSLLVMLSAFAGRDFLISAYEEAIREEYRFFSYGDCMLVL